GVLVDLERVADEGARRDMVDVEDRELLDATLLEFGEQLRIDLVSGLAINLAGLHVDDILGEVASRQIFCGNENLLETALRQLARLASGDLLAGMDHHLASLGVHEVRCRSSAAHSLRRKRHPPAALGLLDE